MIETLRSECHLRVCFLVSLNPLGVGPIEGHEALPMVHHSMGEPEALEPPIGPPPIGVDFGPRPGPPPEVAEEGTPPPIPDDAQAHAALIVDNTQDPYLGVDATDAILAPAEPYPPGQYVQDPRPGPRPLRPPPSLAGTACTSGRWYDSGRGYPRPKTCSTCGLHRSPPLQQRLTRASVLGQSPAGGGQRWCPQRHCTFSGGDTLGWSFDCIHGAVS
jgi:hypothetical protein